MQLLSLIQQYRENLLPYAHTNDLKCFESSHDDEILLRFENLLRQNLDKSFFRDCLPGHITGSALVISNDWSQVLLTLHAKLNLWLQLGGHCDGDQNVAQVAAREIEEESGLKNIKFYDLISSAKVPAVEANSVIPFDFDIHRIPERKTEPEHFHFDVRYLVLADPWEQIRISDESHDLKWFPIEEAYHLTNEKSMHRQFDKVREIAAR